jgi:hypothetical protein
VLRNVIKQKISQMDYEACIAAVVFLLCTSEEGREEEEASLLNKIE